MSKKPFLAAALFALAMIAIPTHAQDAKKEVAVKPADSQSKVVLDSWNDIGRKLIAMAEDFPEDKYDYKPTPAQRAQDGFGQVLIDAVPGQVGEKIHFTGDGLPSFHLLPARRRCRFMFLTRIGASIAFSGGQL